MWRAMTATLPVAVLVAAAPVHADPALIDHVDWVSWQGRPSLRVYPTPAGRAVAAQWGSPADAAWAEVLAAAPDAATPGMREQFVCHWDYAELVEPGKTSWNLEPWRPVVSEVDMLDAGCNPGDAEEPF